MKLRYALLDDLALARFHGKIGLGEGYLGLADIAVLGNQVAGVARELIINYWPFGNAGVYHFRDLTKMGGNWDFSGLARQHGPL